MQLKMRKSLIWSQKEDELIISNFSLIKSKKWKIISNILKIEGFDKKETECRQRYINHLVPTLNKQKRITCEELEIFYSKYEQYGPKWTQLQRFLPTKSQVQLKNIFYGNIRCFVKKIIKYYTKKTAVFVNQIDTFTLQNIYSGKKNFKGLTIIKEDLKKMNYRFDEKLCFHLINTRKDIYIKLFNILLEQNKTKNSKHYLYFQKLSLQNQRSSDFQTHFFVNQQEQRQQVPKEKQQSNPEFVNQIQLPNVNSLQPIQVPVYDWSKNTYFYINQPLIIPLDFDQTSFYMPKTNISYQNYVGYPIVMNNGFSQNMSYFKMY